MIQVEKLRKEFGDLVAVADVSFEARPGEVFGLLGPNGAGKSTTINCICGLLTPTSGRILVDGHNVVTAGPKARASLGVVPQEIALYLDLTARENLEYWGAAQGLRGKQLRDSIAWVLDLVSLTDRANESVKNFSGGMKRRLNLAAGVLHRPKALLLDEPTAGVDPQSRVRLAELVRQLTTEGVCVIYTTHYMDEAEHLCDRLAIVDHGMIIAGGTLDELRAMMGERDLLRLTGNFEGDAWRAPLDALQDLEIVQSDSMQLTVSLIEGSQRLPEVFAALSQAGVTVRDTTLSRPSLESLFIKLTGKELRE